jgi:dihydroflavonol-4-reductase
LPDFVVRIPSSFVPQMRMLTRDLGRVNRASAEKARRVLGFSPRPVANPIVDCGESLSVSHRGIG